MGVAMGHTNLTVVAIYGHSDGSQAIPSILTSMEELPGSSGLLLSTTMPSYLPSNIKWGQIYPMSYQQYSVFVMHSLYAFIETDFCLIVQDDGWVINGKAWKPEYYDYDYIGAATHAAVVGNQLILHGGWVEKPVRTMVQNGGFSLRSKRFLEMPNKLGLVHTPHESIYLWNEDVQLTAVKRNIFEHHGIRYASEKVSRGFAMEYAVNGLYENFDFSQLVGHHGQSRKLITDKHIKVTMSELDVANVVGEVEFLTYLESIGYTVEYVASRNPEKATA